MPAKKSEATYSPKSHSAPHFVGHYVEGMEEWASWYCFNKKEDGTYEAELDEAWDEGSHYGGRDHRRGYSQRVVLSILR
jgi:hypothetical protein